MVAWIHELECWGFPLQVKQLRQMAATVLGVAIENVGKNWHKRFLKRHHLTTLFSRQLDCNRAWNNDPVIIEQWFAFLKEQLVKYDV